MNYILSQCVDEVVTEIGMSQDKRPWLILEGGTDVIFFNSKSFQTNPKLVPVSGWENVTRVIHQTIEEKIDAVVCGFIDRDYRQELGLVIGCDKIVISEFRDLEISMFESNALKKILVEYNSPKLPHLEDERIDVEQVRAKIYSAAAVLGKLRYYSQTKKENISLTCINWKKLLKKGSLEVDLCTFKNYFYSISKLKESGHFFDSAMNSMLPKSLSDPRYLCSGHDVTEILSIALRTQWRSNQSSNITREKLESSLRIGYPDDVFYKTKMYSELKTLLTN